MQEKQATVQDKSLQNILLKEISSVPHGLTDLLNLGHTGIEDNISIDGLGDTITHIN